MMVWEQWSPALAQDVVGADVTASPFNWHFGPFPVRPWRMECQVGCNELELAQLS